ncbi:MAG: hypothetical protein HYZ57_06890 [Acidobacteria bacterium]|nr:hypothetical protein [Acidobacteriota bacterium]MBI3279549.1 hypothetical protein [Acidobacteriota bacterium]
MRRLLPLALTLACAAPAAERWRMQYFHDQDRSSLTLNDIEFVSAKRGIAVGFLRQDGRFRPMSLVTSDGGEHWQQVPLKEAGVSLFFLDEGDCWMVTTGGIWFSEEAGRSWRRIHRRKGLSRVYFTTRERGWAVGAGKTVLATTDGGHTWKAVPAAAAVQTTPEFTSFTWIEFASPQRGLIVGGSRPRRRQNRVPLWMETRPQKRRELPGIGVFLETSDGGATWTSSTASIFGAVTRLRYHAQRRGLALLEHEGFFEFPSELMRLDPENGGIVPAYKRKDRALTDIAFAASGSAYAAGFEPPGLVRASPVPGKVKVLRSTDLSQFEEMDVDYRAVATRVALATAGTDAWLATDTGMILKLIRD